MSASEPEAGAGRLNSVQENCKKVIEKVANGRLVPFLGAGVNLTDRPIGSYYRRGKYLPNGQELALDLAYKFNYPWDDSRNLLRVSAYASLEDELELYRHLHEVFDADYPPTVVHEFFAQLPGVMRAKGYTNPFQLIVTTNYDDVLERAFAAAGEPFHVVYYARAVKDPLVHGKFMHLKPDGTSKMITDPVTYSELPISGESVECTTILKIHGAVNRGSWEESNFVITEDDYIKYLAGMDDTNGIPVFLERKMRNSSFLFLGYSLSDWNLRVLLYRIFDERSRQTPSWAVLNKFEKLDEKFWEKRNVDFFNAPLDKYIFGLQRWLDALS